ncbi:MAG: hypothetical protein ACRD98_09690 [Nitrososphaera sp.]
MTPTEIEQQAVEDAFLRGSLDIPDDAKIQNMSFVQLAALLSSCETGSARFNVVERELKKHLAKDQAEINRKNIFLGACLGGIFGLIGVVLGAHLKNSPLPQQIAPAAAVQQMKKADLGVKPVVGNIAPSTPLTAQPANSPPPGQSNAQASNPRP